MTNVQERVANAVPSFPQSAALERLGPADFGGTRLPAIGRSDIIRRTGPEYRTPPADSTQPAFSGGMQGIMTQLLSIVGQLLSMLGFGGQSFFQNAAASSTGDPHLAFTGTTASGSNEQSRFDSMTAHEDLLHSDSFAGGYQIATSVTQPAANGVTFNQQASVSTNFGRTCVSLDQNGNAAIEEDGQTFSIADGQSCDLGGGESVTRSADGSLVVRADNGFGGTIATTLRQNGKGVDVNVQAAGVDLGGDVLSQLPPAPQLRPAG